MDFKEGEQINTMRIQQVKEAKANILITSCPFCLQMLQDALKTLNLDNEIHVQDIVGLLTS